MTHQTVDTKRSSSRFRFFSEIITELKKVVWLTRREAIYLTGIVLTVALVVGLILGVMDFGFVRLVDDFFLCR